MSNNKNNNSKKVADGYIHFDQKNGKMSCKYEGNGIDLASMIYTMMKEDKDFFIIIASAFLAFEKKESENAECNE